MVYYRERIQIKIFKAKRARGASRTDQAGLSVSLFPGESECSSAMTGDNMCGVLPTGDPHSSLGVQGF